MCQSKEDGGRRCNSSLSGFSNYPEAVRFDAKTGSFVFDEKLLSSDGKYIMATAVVSARSGIPVSKELADAASKSAGLWESMDSSVRWQAWKDISSLDNPSQALIALHEMGWEKNFPALANIRGVVQSPLWHPEGSVEVHTQQAADVAARNATRDGLTGFERRLAVLGAICHDFGKATNTFVDENGKINSIGHESAGVPVARRFLRDIGADEETIRIIPALVREHMCHANKNLTKTAVRKLTARLEEKGTTLEHWARVAEADTGGRGSASESGVSERWFALQAEIEEDERRKDRPSMRVDGPYLKALGIAQGPVYGEVIQEFNRINRETPFESFETRDAWVREYFAKLNR